MTPAQTAAAEAVWQLDAVDPTTKLFLLALVDTGNPEQAAHRARMPAGQARLTLDWLREREIIDANGDVDPTAVAQLEPARTTA